MSFCDVEKSYHPAMGWETAWLPWQSRALGGLVSEIWNQLHFRSVWSLVFCYDPQSFFFFWDGHVTQQIWIFYFSKVHVSTLLSGLTDTVFVGYFGFKMALETDNHKNIKWKSDFFIDRKWKAACFCKCCHVTEAGKNRLTIGSCHGKHGAFPWRYISLSCLLEVTL